MTEAEWLACGDPGRVWYAIMVMGQVLYNPRKLRLFATAACRRHWSLLHPGRQAGVEVSERFADQAASPKELAEYFDRLIADGRANAAAHHACGSSRNMLEHARQASIFVVYAAGDLAPGDRAQYARADENRALTTLLRDIFGNPFRPVASDPAWLTWNGGTIPTLAQAVYEERDLPSGHLDSVRLALLADMLEDAGCSDVQVLEHLRGHGPHVRGCWVVDILLGKM